MAGIYLHIPFCRQACTYCNFHFTTSTRYKDELVQAIATEAAMETGYLDREPVTSIYFGGGTPSILEAGQLETLLSALAKHYSIHEEAEITLEANPDDIDQAALKSWKGMGINRLSIGVQSFLEEELRWMNRAHTAELATRCLELATGEFQNLTADLIYGSPFLTDEHWKQHVHRMVSMGVPHLSCYALTVEEKTPLHKMIRTEPGVAPDDEKQARQYLLLMQWMREKGYEHYEVSNFTLPGFRSRHNSSYWKGEKYLGLGPSAHSFNGIHRRWNIANNQLYLRSIKAGDPQRETETLTRSQRLNELIMISLRTSEGIDLRDVEQHFGNNERTRIADAARKFQQQGWLMSGKNTIVLTDEGMLRADGIASELFV